MALVALILIASVTTVSAGDWIFSNIVTVKVIMRHEPIYVTPRTLSPPPKPAKFVLSDLAIAPAEPGEEVTISLKVTNVGDLEGSATVDLLVNDVKEQSKSVTLAVGASTMVSFSVTKTTEDSYAIHQRVYLEEDPG